MEDQYMNNETHALAHIVKEVFPDPLDLAVDIPKHVMTEILDAYAHMQVVHEERQKGGATDQDTFIMSLKPSFGG